MSDDDQVWVKALMFAADKLVSEVDKVPSTVLLMTDITENDQGGRARTFMYLVQQQQRLDYALAAMRMLAAVSPEAFGELKDEINDFADVAQCFGRALDEFERRFISGGSPAFADPQTDHRLLEEMYENVKRLTEIYNPDGIVGKLKAQVHVLLDEKRIAFDQKVQSLSPDQREIYEAADTEIARTGQEIMAHTKAKLTFNSTAKSYLSLLTKLELLKKVPGGYVKVPPPGSQEAGQD